MRVLLSIKPHYADLIFDGSKIYEFRKSIFRAENVKTIIVYATSPVQLVLGEFDIETILRDKPENLWKRTQGESGITFKFFNEYFMDREYGYAIKIERSRLYKRPYCIRSRLGISPPQSFCYI